MAPKIGAQVEAEWIDSQSWSGWHSPESVVKDHSDDADKSCRTTGYLVINDKSGVTIAQNRTVPLAADGQHPRSWGETMFIPRVAIRKLTELGPKGR